MLERPTTTASRPASEACTVLASRTQPSGVQGTSAGRPVAQPADIERMKAVDVLGRIDRGDDLLRVDLRRQRQLHQDAVHRGSALSLRDQRQQLGFAGRRRQPVVERRACRPPPAPWSCCGHRLSLAGLLPTSTTASPGVMPRSRAGGAPRRATLPRKSGRDRLAVDDLCGHGASRGACVSRMRLGASSAGGAEQSPPDRADLLQRGDERRRRHWRPALSARLRPRRA